MKNKNAIFRITFLLLIFQINAISLKKALSQLQTQRTLDDYRDTVSIKKEVDDEKTRITITIEHNNEEKIPEMISSLFDTSNKVVMDNLKDYNLEDQKPEEKSELVPEPEKGIQQDEFTVDAQNSEDVAEEVVEDVKQAVEEGKTPEEVKEEVEDAVQQKVEEIEQKEDLKPEEVENLVQEVLEEVKEELPKQLEELVPEPEQVNI